MTAPKPPAVPEQHLVNAAAPAMRQLLRRVAARQFTADDAVDTMLGWPNLAVPDTGHPAPCQGSCVGCGAAEDQPCRPGCACVRAGVHDMDGEVPDTGHPAAADRIEAVVRAASHAFRAYTGTREGEPMWNLDMEATWRIIAPAVLASASPSGDTGHPDLNDEFGVTCTVCGEPATDERPTVETDDGATHPECCDPGPSGDTGQEGRDA